MISLREYTKADRDRLVLLANNINVSRYLADTFPFPYTEQDADWWIETGSVEKGAVTRVIEYKGEFAGSVGIVPQDGWKSHLAGIGYWIGEPYWGKGIASEALRAMSELSFTTLNYRKLYADVLEPNRVSMRVLEKCGYSLEGILKGEVIKGGKYYDIYRHASYRW